MGVRKGGPFKELNNGRPPAPNVVGQRVSGMQSAQGQKTSCFGNLLNQPKFDEQKSDLNSLGLVSQHRSMAQGQAQNGRGELPGPRGKGLGFGGVAPPQSQGAFTSK